MAYTLLQEEDWKQKISKAAREQGVQAPQVLERSGKEYKQYFFEYFKNHIKEDNSQTFLLDAGCGTGKIAKKLADEVYNCEQLVSACDQTSFILASHLSHPAVARTVSPLFDIADKINFIHNDYCKNQKSHP